MDESVALAGPKNGTRWIGRHRLVRTLVPDIS